jgi:8-hydroxy-5-deazaflavin:NADPH oxidoreductase
MKITIVGTGNMGTAFGKRLTASGHDVTLTGRNLEAARKLASSLGPKAKAAPPDQAASGAEIVIAATPYSEQANALRSLGALNGQVIVEISNPLTPDFSGLAIGHSTSAAEEVAKAVRGVRVVKAFNTILAQVLAEGAELGRAQRTQVFYAGDDATAKRAVRSLIESVGFEPMDAGPLANARYLEPMGMLNIYFAYSAKIGGRIAPVWLRG